MRYKTVMYCKIFFLCITISITSAEQDALIFNRSDSSHLFLPDNNPSESLGDWVTACPAETQSEKDFIANKSSLKKNGLFVKEIYKEGSKASEVKKNICQESFKTSLAYKVKDSTFQFGYEIYYKHTDPEQLHDYYNPQDYRSPNQVITKMKTIISKGLHETTQNFRNLHQSIGIGNKKLRMNGEKMKFKWLYLFKLKFNLRKKILKMIWYEIQANSRWEVPDICEDYSLGSELYEDIDPDYLYSGVSVNQVKVFEKSQGTYSQFCKSVDKLCLMKWPLIPLDHFNFGSKIPPLCSNIITIPIWTIGKVKNYLKKVDQYLYALFKVLKEPIHVISGIAEEYKIWVRNPRLKIETVYLDSVNERISVPQFIYKIVEYRLKDCKLEENSCWYSAVIVIINNPEFNYYQGLICTKDDEVTREWGWDEITRDSGGNSSYLVYVCKNNEKTRKELSLKSTKKVTGDLNLSKFIYSDNGGETLEEKNIKALVDKKFKEFALPEEMC